MKKPIGGGDKYDDARRELRQLSFISNCDAEDIKKTRDNHHKWKSSDSEESSVLRWSPMARTIFSPFPDIQIAPEELVSVNLLLRKSKEHAQEGRTIRIMDTGTGESYDFESFERQTRSIASALYKRGFRNGDVALYMTTDIVKLQLFHMGVWRANGIPRASYPEDDEETILHRVEESRIGWIYCEPEASEICLSVASKVYWDVEVIVSTDKAEGCTSIYDFMRDYGSEMPEFQRNGEDPCIILNTSGTTGTSKGAVISHAAFAWMLRTFDPYVNFDESPDLMMVSKGTHISGALIPFTTLMIGRTIYVMQTIKTELMFEAIHEIRPKMIFAFPTLLVALINHPNASSYDFSCLEVALSGGAPVTSAIEEIVMQLPQMKYVMIVYGLTEVAPVVGNGDSSHSDNLKIDNVPENSIGWLCGGVSAQFRDLETNEVLGPNQTGELCLKCPGLFTEYFGNPEATADAFVDGFFRTGDVGFYDDEEFIHLIDRAKEIFKYYGNHVSPTEIENVINVHPAVGEVCVVGVPDPEGGGHVPRAFCVILQEWDCTPEEIQEFTNYQLPNYKHLRGGVHFLPKLPKGKTGKISRQLVSQLSVE